MEDRIAARLSESSVFEGLTPEQIEQILPCVGYMVRHYGSQECVCGKGEKVRHLGLVLDGELTICDEGGGKRVEVGNIEKNGLFGEVAVLSSGSTLPHSVIASRDAQVLYLSGDFFLIPCGKACDKKQLHQEVLKNMLRLLSDRAVLLNKKIAYLTASDLKTKIAMYLCELYEVNRDTSFHMPLNRDRLADFFAVARPSLSRELIALKNQGVIDFYRSSVTILDLDALYGIARGE